MYNKIRMIKYIYAEGSHFFLNYIASVPQNINVDLAYSVELDKIAHYAAFHLI